MFKHFVHFHSLAWVGLSLLLSACGGYESTMSDTDRALFDRFVGADVASVDEQGFAELVDLSQQLITGSAVTTMSGEETDQTTGQVEAMIARLESELASETDKKVKSAKGRTLYQLKKAIGRGGA